MKSLSKTGDGIPAERFSFIKIFIFILIFEVVVGGGGRLLDIGAVSPRMLLFSLSLLLSFLLILIKLKINRNSVIITSIYFFYIAYSSLVGVARMNDINLIVQDVKPLLYFLLFPFVYYFKEIFFNLIFSAIKIGAPIMGACYLVAFYLLNSGLVPFSAIYVINESGEFFFRGESAFVYKGFIYLIIGCFLYLIGDSKLQKLIGLCLLVPIYLLYTRGFLISLAFGIFFFYWIRNQSLDRIKLFFAALIMPMLVMLYISGIERGEGDSKRINDLIFLWDSFSDVSTIIVGNGFGSLISGNLKIEVALLEVLYKSGLVGLAFWMILIFIQLIWYQLIKVKCIDDHAMISIVVILYVQSLFNPYINNSIGMLFLMVSFCYFDHRKSQTDDK
ncbi:O-antigen polymerase [Ferrimonas balearica DSM 9799]|uniref:O-antigen polymerase n=1 Tax=Ferrimonas balearica (strain DSM 9799 / CCM 4581 / KCTC 23876 / PAT) TaxID=550540 RepID=E1SUU3_FERBD|nr:O-antigen polymerase [Ferrimonas balearica]ADN75284.1 O-antigen polymerase [Ferrimonas balearica DSM 9799]